MPAGVCGWRVNQTAPIVRSTLKFCASCSLQAIRNGADPAELVNMRMEVLNVALKLRELATRELAGPQVHSGPTALAPTGNGP